MLDTTLARLWATDECLPTMDQQHWQLQSLLNCLGDRCCSPVDLPVMMWFSRCLMMALSALMIVEAATAVEAWFLPWPRSYSPSPPETHLFPLQGIWTTDRVQAWIHTKVSLSDRLYHPLTPQGSGTRLLKSLAKHLQTGSLSLKDGRHLTTRT